MTDLELLEILDTAATKFGAYAGACKVLADGLRFGRRGVAETVALLQQSYPELLEPISNVRPAANLPAPLPYTFSGEVSRRASDDALAANDRNRFQKRRAA